MEYRSKARKISRATLAARSAARQTLQCLTTPLCLQCLCLSSTSLDRRCGMLSGWTVRSSKMLASLILREYCPSRQVAPQAARLLAPQATTLDFASHAISCIGLPAGQALPASFAISALLGRHSDAKSTGRRSLELLPSLLLISHGLDLRCKCPIVPAGMLPLVNPSHSSQRSHK